MNRAVLERTYNNTSNRKSVDVDSFTEWSNFTKSARVALIHSFNITCYTWLPIMHGKEKSNLYTKQKDRIIR